MSSPPRTAAAPAANTRGRIRLLLALGCALSWCAPQVGHTAKGAQLTVSAATSLSNVLRELAPGFEASHPGVRVRFNFAASGVLLQQILQGAPIDVFVSADADTMDRAVAKGLVDPRARRDVARNALVVAVPTGAPGAPTHLAGLLDPSIRRVVIGLPESVPAGRYAHEALLAAGLDAALRPKVVRAHHVRQALDYVARGEVDAGFVYATDASLAAGKVRVAFGVPTATPIRYPAAPLRASPQPSLAGAFVDYLGTREAQSVMARHGFSPPQPAAAGH